MAHFFNYDFCKNKHQIYGLEVKNEKGEIVGYRPLVQRFPKHGGVVEVVSESFPQVKWKIFSSEKLARDFAIKFFNSLDTVTLNTPHEFS